MGDALPNASFISFTGTPIEQNDANTRAAFGAYVSVYDIQQAVIDKKKVEKESPKPHSDHPLFKTKTNFF